VFDAASVLIWLAPPGLKAPVVSVDVATHVMRSYAHVVAAGVREEHRRFV
jgi:hypothetical protein